MLRNIDSGHFLTSLVFSHVLFRSLSLEYNFIGAWSCIVTGLEQILLTECKSFPGGLNISSYFVDVSYSPSKEMIC